MAIHNQLFRQNWSEALKRAIGDNKQEGGLERYGETLTPTIDLWKQPEWAFLRQERLWAATRTVTAIAAEFSMCAIVNPAGSGQIVVIDKITGGAAAGSFQISLDLASLYSATLALNGSTVLRDERFSPANSVVQVFTGTDAALFTNTVETQTTPDTRDVVFSSPPYILPPVNVNGPGAGRALVVQFTTVNTGAHFNFAGYVRAALPGEL